MKRVLLVLLTGAVFGCAGDARMPQGAVETGNAPSWPDPPDRTRIQYLYSFSDHADLGLKQSFFARLRDALGGGVENRMVRPYSIAVDDRMIAVADPGLSALHVFDVGRGTYRYATRFGDIRFNSPVGVALAEDHVFLADSARNAVFIMDRGLEPVVSIPGLNRPTSLAWDASSGRLFVAETHAHRLQVYDAEGNHLATIGGRGVSDRLFNFPTHLAVAEGLLLVNDTMNFKVKLFNIDGSFVSMFGRQGDEAGFLAHPKGLAVDSEGHIYVAEAVAGSIQIFDRDGRFLMEFGGPGLGAGAFAMPAGLAMSQDRLYVCDSRNGRVQVFQYLRDEERP